MSNFSKIIIVIILVLSFFFIKEKTGFKFDFISSVIKMPKLEVPGQNDKNEIVKAPSEIIKVDKEQLQFVNIYFLALDSNNNGIYKVVKREVPLGVDKFDFAINELLKGPNIIEKTSGTYSEIPQTTKLLGIKQKGNKIIIDFSSDFQYGGGTDSIYSRMMQLIKTSIENSENKKIYLYLDGKQIKFIGGEGIMISQPLNEKSLEI